MIIFSVISCPEVWWVHLTNDVVVMSWGGPFSLSLVVAFSAPLARVGLGLRNLDTLSQEASAGLRVVELSALLKCLENGNIMPLGQQG